MTDFITCIKVILASIGAFLGAFIGGLSGLVVALIALMICDYITGVLVGIKERKLNSTVGFWGLVKKCLILLLIGVANMIDVNVIGSGSMTRTATTVFYLANDGLSIMENIGALGVPLPKKLKRVLEQLKEEEDE